ncbi:MAG: hypothetical protein V5A43_02665 [Haloarculaceae archaeon]
MATRVAERLDGWNSRSFTGGYHELNDLADEGFSGIVRAGGAELSMTTGTVVGVQRGTIEDFEDASGTVLEAPSPALPLLAVMQEADADVRAKYYSEDTPMSEVDRTLSDGSFTGYIELSENVLSGDYYLVYHGGRSMAVAFVGNSAQLVTDDEAFETADDEVGIYKVRQVDIEPIDIPAPEGDRPTGGRSDDGPEAAAAAAGTAGASAATPEANAEAESDGAQESPEPGSPSGAGASSEDTADPAAETGAGGGPATAAGSETTRDSNGADTGTDAEAGAGADSDGRSDSPASAGGGADGGAGSSGEAAAAAGTSTSSTDTSPDHPGPEDAGPGSREPEGAVEGGTSTEPRSDRKSQSARGEAASVGQSGGTTAGDTGRKKARQPGGTAGGSAADLETRSIPSLDPERTEAQRRSSGRAGGARGDAPGRGRPGTGDAGATQQPTQNATGRATGSTQEPQPGEAGRQTDSPSQAGSEAASAGAGTEAPRADASADGVAQERLEELQAELTDREEEVDRLESELDRVRTERADLKEQLESAREERDELAEQVDRLESELSRLEDELGAATDAERRLTAREALDGTDVFVRYHSKGDATLQKAHDGSVRRDDVTDNLRLEKHTQFDASNVAVGGQNYPEFIEARPEYQFVRWTVEELLFEIRDTGHAEALKVLYDGLPKVDRAELNGVIEVTFTEDGQETRTEETFDVILRDRMGNPLLVANLNDAREGASEAMMSDLITASERVGQTTDSMAGAFLVTRSFFEPDALETAEEATRSGILSRDKRRSFVNISRKRGFHLCLVEARNQNFHLAVPEL